MKNQSGKIQITLIETLVIIAIISLIALVGLSTYYRSDRVDRCFEGHLYGVDKDNVMHPKFESRYRGTGPAIKCN